MQDHLFGVDVSKDKLDIASLPGQSLRCIGNDAKSIDAWLKTLPPDSHVAMESTGRYHQLLADRAQQARVHVYVLNPKRVLSAARGEGRRSKTDQLDAQVIVNYLRNHQERLHEWTPGTAVQRQITTLERRRVSLERQLTALRMTTQDLDGLDDQVKALLDSAKALRQAIDGRIRQLAQSEESLAQKSRLLEQIPTIGPMSAISLATLFARVPFTSSDAVVAFLGLDVRARDSGMHRGKRHLTKWGPAYLRKRVWLFGFTAAHTKLFKPRYQQLRARGLSFTAAALILGRRILRLAWAVWRTGVAFDAHRLAA